MARRCLVLGDVMMDVTAIIDSDIAYASDTPARVSLQAGGVGGNTAAWMAFGGHQVTLLGCIGADPFGQRVRDDLAALGVDVQLQTSEHHRTGTVVIIVDRRRERTMFPDAGANSDLTLQPMLDLITGNTHVHFSGYTLLNPDRRETGLQLLAHAEDVGATRSLDPSSAAPLRAQHEFITSLLPRFNLLLANEDEAGVLTGRDDPHDALDALADVVDTVVVKIGPRGALARDSSGRVSQPALRLDVVDTTGAGDAFTAGFLPAWLADSPLEEAVMQGQRLAGIVVGRVGATPLTP